MSKEKIFFNVFGILLACFIILTTIFIESGFSEETQPSISYTIHCPAEALPVE